MPSKLLGGEQKKGVAKTWVIKSFLIIFKGIFFPFFLDILWNSSYLKIALLLLLTVTALLFKMEEANIASRAKAQEFIQATSQVCVSC